MNKRGAGILLHITSLPSPYGIGDLGPWAYRFADFLVETKQTFWQVLPTSPTSSIYGHSPYSSVSAFAGNTLLVSPDLLVEEGLLTKEEVDERPLFLEDYCDHDAVAACKERLLRSAWERFRGSGQNHYEYGDFCLRHGEWLDDYTLFKALKRRFGGKAWIDWPVEARDRLPEYLEEAKKGCAEDVEEERFLQYLFHKQWSTLREYCNRRGVKLLGDIPIYVSLDSSDAWANASLFKLDGQKRPISVAGVPPDYFSVTGQRWGNPVYDWAVLKETGFAWWIKRMGHILSMFDMVRIDHFRGLIAYWAIPAHEKTAVRGEWVGVPTNEFFGALMEHFHDLPVIAEDLGIITQDVKEAMDRLGFPGMKVLLFAFGDDNPAHPYLPHNYERNCVVYTGTHDYSTVRGWFDKEAGQPEKERLFQYLGREVGADEVAWELIRLAMMSVADTAIVPMQDVLGLGLEARMNRPSIGGGNWCWRLRPDQLGDVVASRLRSMTETYGRA